MYRRFNIEKDNKMSKIIKGPSSFLTIVGLLGVCTSIGMTSFSIFYRALPVWDIVAVFTIGAVILTGQYINNKNTKK